VDQVADLELGPPQHLVVGLGGEQFGDAPEVDRRGLHEGLVDAFGLFLLLRIERSGGVQEGPL